MLIGIKFMFPNVSDLKFGHTQRKPLPLTAQLLENGILTEQSLDIILILRDTMPENSAITISIQLLSQPHRITPALTVKMH